MGKKSNFSLDIIGISHFYDRSKPRGGKKNLLERKFLRPDMNVQATSDREKRVQSAPAGAESMPLCQQGEVLKERLFLDQTRADIFEAGLEAGFVIRPHTQHQFVHLRHIFQYRIRKFVIHLRAHQQQVAIGFGC